MNMLKSIQRCPLKKVAEINNAANCEIADEKINMNIRKNIRLINEEIIEYIEVEQLIKVILVSILSLLKG